MLYIKKSPSLVATMTSGAFSPIATTLLTGLPLRPLGILTQAKSRDGSQISVTAEGRYPAARETSEVETFCDVRRTMDMKPGERKGLADESADGEASRLELEEGSEEPVGLILRSRVYRRGVVGPSLG